MADMSDFFKKAVFAGLGLAAAGKAKVEEFAKEYANFYNKSEEEGRTVYEQVSEEARRMKEEMENSIRENTEKISDRFNKKLIERIEALEFRVSELEKRAQGNTTDGGI